MANRYSKPFEMQIDSTKKYTATIKTPRGNIVAQLLPDIAPVTVNNFVFLARNNFYNGLTWHRVLPGFMAQGGDPLTKDEDPRNDGTGGPFTITARAGGLQKSARVTVVGATAVVSNTPITDPLFKDWLSGLPFDLA